ncbi:MAG: hypothetical protein ACTSXH_08825, partial [Promethearchaeota archaeon]
MPHYTKKKSFNFKENYKFTKLKLVFTNLPKNLLFLLLNDPKKMEPKTKKIVAIIIIVIIAVGLGLGTWYAVTPRYGQVQTGTLVTPSAPGGITEDQVIKIGVLGALTEIQGESQWYGVYMAVDELNQAGGVVIDGKTYYFGLVGEDTYEADTYLDVTKGVAAAQKMVQQHKPHFIIGGFRTEALLTYQEV